MQTSYSESIVPKYNTRSPQQAQISQYFNSKNTCFFHKSDFKQCHVIDVVQKSYIIICLKKDQLYAIDLHAASEKLLYMQCLNNLSNLRKEQRLSQQKACSLSRNRHQKETYHVANIYKQTLIMDMQKINRLGWYYKVHEQSRSGCGGSYAIVQIEVLPELFGIRLRQDDFMHYIENLFQNENQMEVESFADKNYGIRPSQHQKQIIAQYACHNAFRFGDDISLQKATQLVRKLGDIQAPFNCPHSRICIVSIGSMKQFVQSK